MSGPFGSQQWMYSTGFYPYEIDQSLRFNDDDSAYLTRTPASSSNRKTWTWSGWVKASEINSGHDHLFAATSDYNNGSLIRINNDRTFQYLHFDNNSAAINKKTSALIRDPSAWYHFVVVYDSDNSTAEDRVKLYINGVRQTSFNTNTNPSSGKESDFNLVGRSNFIGLNSDNTNVEPFDGYMAEVNFIDGQALDPTDFGETKSGVWIPKSYSGSYGTNGFYLDFGNSASLGADSSGNSNNFTPTNLAATDQVLDSPTNNFPTFSPAALDNDRDYLTLLAEGNLRINRGIVSGEGGSIGVPFAVSSGKWYFEGELSEYSGSGALRLGFNTEDNFNGSGNAYKEVSTNGLYMIAIDVDNKLYWTGANGTWDAGDPDAGTGGTSYTSSVDGMVPFVRDNSGSVNNGGTWTLNFGQDSSFAGNQTAQGNTDANGIGDFYYSPPAGYLALCSANLPDPVIDPAKDDVPADYFNTVLYTGDGTSDRDITGVGFQPDFVWHKSRSDTRDHRLLDAVRGATLGLSSNLTIAEYTESTGLTSFDSDGFSIGNAAAFNTNTETYVAWNWKAGGTGVSNTDGTITSTVSANTDAGFSIVAYTGTGVAATVGHGLSSAPDMYIVKNRDESTNADWAIWHKDFSNGGDGYLYLNGNNAEQSGTFFWNSTVPSSTVISLGNQNRTNDSSNNYIAYCFHSVEGYSKFGGYTGNGDADGPFVYTGFRPAFVMIKRTDASNNWYIHDTTRDTENVAGKFLYPNLSNAEADVDNMDILSNGFKLRSTATSGNASSGEYIYMAFAEMPFKYANAR